MSDDWLIGSQSKFNRILDSVGTIEADKVTDALKSGRVEKWVVHTDPAGGTSVWLVDSAGKIVKANSAVTSKVLVGLK